MINVKGIVQNNESTNEFLKQLKSSEKQYKNLTYKKEREMIESCTRLIRDEKGMPVIDHIEKKTNRIIYKYEILDGYEEIKNELVMHHIRRVFNLSKTYAQNTRDFDDLIAKGLYGLKIAAEKFNPYLPVQDKGIPEVKCWEKDGKTPKYTKFITSATNWILKYLRQEFNDKKAVLIDNNSISIDTTPRIKNSTDNNHTMENYIDSMIAPGCEHKTIDSEISSMELTDIYKNIYEYVISDESQLSSIEKQIFVDSFYNHKPTREIAEELNSKLTTITSKKKKVLGKVRNMLSKKMNINSIDDVLM